MRSKMRMTSEICLICGQPYTKHLQGLGNGSLVCGGETDRVRRKTKGLTKTERMVALSPPHSERQQVIQDHRYEFSH